MNLELALALAEQGIYVFPCIGEGPNPKQPCRGVGWKALSTTDPRVIAAWWAKFPNAAPAIDCGKSGLIAVDCDRKLADGLAWIREQGIDPDAAPGSITPSGGRHLVYRNTIGAGNGRGSLPGKEVADIDIRGDGGFILAPGAVFVDGSTVCGYYQPIGRLEDAPPLPALLAEMLQGVRGVPLSNHEGDLNGEVFEPLSFTVHSEPVSDIRKHHYGQTALEELERDLAGAPEGNRNNEAARIAFKVGQLVGGGCIDVGEAYQRLEAAALSWGIGLRDKALGARGTIWRAIQAGMGEPRGPTEERSAVVINLGQRMGGGGSAPDPIPTPLATPYQWVDPDKIPMRAWLYGDLLVRKFVSLTVAPGGAGKSSLLTAETLAQISGRDLLRVALKSQLRVWLWNLEDPIEETKRKIQATAKDYKLTREDIGDRLFVNSGRDQPLVVAKMQGTSAFVVQPMVDALIAEIKRLAIDVIVIDPFVSCHEVPENDNGAQDKVVKAWAKVADLAECAVHLVDHTRKAPSGTEVTTESVRGGKAKTDACRVVRVVNPMTEAEGKKAGVENYRSYFRTYNDKANLAPPADKSNWFEIKSVYLGNGSTVLFQLNGRQMEIGDAGDSVGVVVPWEWPDPLDGVTGADFDKAAVVIRSREWRESSQSNNWVGFAIGEALGLSVGMTEEEEANRVKVKGMIKAWLKSGALITYSGKDEKSMPRQFIKVRE